jgi:hypothetical protein
VETPSHLQLISGYRNPRIDEDTQPLFNEDVPQKKNTPLNTKWLIKSYKIE